MINFEKKEALKNDIENLKKITKIISIIRLILAFFVLGFIIALCSLQSYLLYGLLSGISLIIFIFFVIYTNKYFRKLTILENKSKVYNLHERRRNLDLNYLTDTGADFLNKDDYKLSDLDIFGKKSLFQYLTSCKTSYGRKLLAKELSNPDKLDEGFIDSVVELGNDEKSIDIEASIYNFGDEYKRLSMNELLSVVGNKIKYRPIMLIPALSFIAMLIYLILVFTIKLNPYGLIIFPVINYASSRITLNNEIFALDSVKYEKMLDKYSYVIEEMTNTSFNTPYLNSLKNDISSYKDSLKKMNNIFNTLSSRKNALANLLLNAICVYDLFIIFIYNHNDKRLTDINGLFLSVSKLELLLSYANIAIDNETYAVPKNDNKITGKNMYHPLVKNCVSNDFSLDGGVILTGSNMSGKTTFMRTLGINQILFNAGSIVFAQEFSSENIPVFTSLRANDMLQEGISTFYAEILRMKLMNEAINRGKCLLLVDEIFKGTNAYERIEGSKIVIQKFVEKKVLFIVSTHDFELCDCPNILNYHFNENYNDDKISFDYKIKDGKCETRNALYLLKLSNII